MAPTYDVGMAGNSSDEEQVVTKKAHASTGTNHGNCYAVRAAGDSHLHRTSTTVSSTAPQASQGEATTSLLLQKLDQISTQVRQIESSQHNLREDVNRRFEAVHRKFQPTEGRNEGNQRNFHPRNQGFGDREREHNSSRDQYRENWRNTSNPGRGRPEHQYSAQSRPAQDARQGQQQMRNDQRNHQTKQD